MSRLFCYGENSFTFLLFHALAADDLVQKVLLPNMRRIIDNRSFRDAIPDVVPDIYLFPNFGKQKGFGEPDALVVIGDHTFWFEVETMVDLLKGKTTFEKALLQLFRFNCLAWAISGGCRTRKDAGRHHLAVRGITVGDNLKPRTAVLRLAGHQILEAVRKRISKSVTHGNDHYILLLDRKASGITSDGVPTRFRDSLATCHKNMQSWSEADNSRGPVPELPEQRFWRVYWRGGLDKKFFVNEELMNPLATPGGVLYIPTVSSTRR